MGEVVAAAIPSVQALLEPVQLGDFVLRNRVVMAPMTRSRATEQGVPTEIMIEYYKQRASAGLLISEGTGISQAGLGWFCAPGIYTQEQVEKWKPITKAVHEAGGVFFLQLWHMGRQMHSDVSGLPIVSASPIPLSAPITARNGQKRDPEVPHALTVEEIAATVQDYATAAKNAIDAGFDGVEIHGSNGYLVDQFMQSKSNIRDDEYGGSINNRLRFMREVVEAVIRVVPNTRVGIRLGPNGVFGEMGSVDSIELFSEAIKYCASKQLAYVHVMDGLGFGFHKVAEVFTIDRASQLVKQVQGNNTTTKVIGNAGYTRELAEERIRNGETDLVAFGRPYLSNPDLVERFRLSLPLAADAAHEFWYHAGYGTRGYTDFPAYKA